RDGNESRDELRIGPRALAIAWSEHGMGIRVDPARSHATEVALDRAQDLGVAPRALPQCLRLRVKPRVGEVMRRVNERCHARDPDPEIVVQAVVERLVEVSDTLDDFPPEEHSGLADEARLLEPPHAEWFGGIRLQD